MKLSIIVPVHNSKKTIDQCLKHIFDSYYKNFEVIVVDDCSTDSTIEKVKKYNCKIIRLKKNKGVANARNIGAENSKSKFLVFVDSDILVYEDTFSKMVEEYKSNPEIKSIGAIDSGEYISGKFGEKFITLKRSYAYKWKAKEKCRLFSCIQSECGFIEKSVFDDVNGFDLKYKDVGVEEYEFAHRLLRKGYKNCIYRDILYRHYKGSLNRRARELFKRTSTYVPLFLRKRSFESEGCTGSVFDSLMTLFSFLSIMSVPLGLISAKLLIIPVFFLMIILVSHIRFLYSMSAKEGILFSFLSYFASIYLYIATGFGIVYGVYNLIRLYVIE